MVCIDYIYGEKVGPKTSAEAPTWPVPPIHMIKKVALTSHRACPWYVHPIYIKKNVAQQISATAS
jgi:hypothetical protein